MKNIVSFLCLLAINVSSLAQTFTVDGLNYEVISTDPNEVKITGGTPATSDLVIPPSVIDNGITYNVTTIGVQAFGLEEGDGTAATITSVLIPNTVREIQDRAFSENQITGNLVIPNSVTTFGIDVFTFNQITSVILPTGLTEIPEGILAFNDITDIADVTIPDSVTIIGNDAFHGNDLTELMVPEGVTTIGDRAFRQNNLTTVSIPSTVTAIGSSAFELNNITQFSCLATTAPPIITQGFFATFDNDVSNATLNIPANTLSSYIDNGWGVFGTIIAGGVTFNSAFTVDGINYLVLGLQPNEVTVIGQEATLTSINIPVTVSDAGRTYDVVAVREFAFDGDNLNSITFPNTLREIGDNAFINNQITSVILPDDLIVLGRTAFSNNQINTLTINSNLTTIENSSFKNNQLTSVHIPNNITTIGNETFRDNQIESLVIPNSVTEIDGNAFRGNDIASVTLSESLTTIGQFAFEDNNLTTITIPNSVAFIGNSAFSNNQLEALVIPDNVTSMGTRVFQNNNIASLRIGSGISVIGTDVFNNNQLTQVTIPSNVISIGFRSFSNNPLTTVISEATTPPEIITGTSDSFGNRSNVDLFIPTGTAQAYEEATWTGFNSVTEANKALALKVFLQGASINPSTGEEDLMRDDLRVAEIIPIVSPYEDALAVLDTLALFTTTGPNAIVDWVFVELRSGADNDNTTVVASQSALLQRDGDIVGVDGTSSITFTEEAGDYFIAIKHRNHIGILTAVPAPLSSTVSTLDFTQDAAFAKGENLALTQVNGTFAMIAGDADGSSQILNTDITEALTLAGGGESYSTADADMNGFVLNSDIQLLILANSGTVQQFE